MRLVPPSIADEKVGKKGALWVGPRGKSKLPQRCNPSTTKNAPHWALEPPPTAGLPDPGHGGERTAGHASHLCASLLRYGYACPPLPTQYTLPELPETPQRMYPHHTPSLHPHYPLYSSMHYPGQLAKCPPLMVSNSTPWGQGTTLQATRDGQHRKPCQQPASKPRPGQHC